MRLSFAGIKAPVLLESCPEVARALEPLFNGWAFGQTADNGPDPAIVMAAREGAYHLSAPGIVYRSQGRQQERYTALCPAVCSLIADIILAYAENSPSVLCLHGAGVVVRGRLLAFPATGNSGKSTLSVHLTARGGRLFSDDVLPLDEAGNNLSAMGIAPRLRLPLPAPTKKALSRYIESRRLLAGEDYLYLKPDPANWAPHGEKAPLSAIVLLDRRPEKTAAVIEQLSKSETLQTIVRQNFAAKEDVVRRFERLHHLVESVPCYILRYADADEAAGAVFEHFSS